MSKSKKDGIYRAALRRDSTHMRRRVEQAGLCIHQGRLAVEPEKPGLTEARRRLERGWRAVAEALAGQGHHDLAEGVSRFVGAMPVPRTDKELMVDRLLRLAKVRPHILERIR